LADQNNLLADVSFLGRDGSNRTDRWRVGIGGRLATGD
jgi:hypothetical protein